MDDVGLIYISSDAGQYLVVSFDKGGRQMLHPTWHLTYLDGGAT